jgi:GT2 family glycosyltransferase
MISVVLPIYLPSPRHKAMTDKCISIAKSNTYMDIEWVIVETCSELYEEEADIYIHEFEKTTPNKSINKAFRAAEGDYIIFLANDVFVDKGWVECMKYCFDKYEDCGLASLGTKEFNQTQKDEIIEKPYFSVCMFRKDDAWFDPNYDDLFDDSDMLMRIMTRGEKCYQNLNCIVDHMRHQTYGPPDLSTPNNRRQHEYFLKKWQNHKDHPAYKLFA